MRAFIGLISGIVAVVIAILMSFMGAGHTFSTSGGAIYYGLLLVLLAGGVLVIIVSWSYLPNGK